MPSRAARWPLHLSKGLRLSLVRLLSKNAETECFFLPEQKRAYSGELRVELDGLRGVRDGVFECLEHDVGGDQPPADDELDDQGRHDRLVEAIERDPNQSTDDDRAHQDGDGEQPGGLTGHQPQGDQRDARQEQPAEGAADGVEALSPAGLGGIESEWVPGAASVSRWPRRWARPAAGVARCCDAGWC